MQILIAIGMIGVIFPLKCLLTFCFLSNFVRCQMLLSTSGASAAAGTKRCLHKHGAAPLQAPSGASTAAERRLALRGASKQGGNRAGAWQARFEDGKHMADKPGTAKAFSRTHSHRQALTRFGGAAKPDYTRSTHAGQGLEAWPKRTWRTRLGGAAKARRTHRRHVADKVLRRGRSGHKAYRRRAHAGQGLKGQPKRAQGGHKADIRRTHGGQGSGGCGQSGHKVDTRRTRFGGDT